MQFRVFASLTCLLGLALVNTVNAAIDPVSLAVIVVAGLAIAKEKLIFAAISRKKKSGAGGEGGYGAPSSGYGAPRSGYGAPAPRSQFGAPWSGFGAPRTGFLAPWFGFGQKRRGKRDVNEDVAFEPLFESANELDTDDCAKLMVCHVYEKSQDQLNTFETKIKALFGNDGGKIEAGSAKAQYQLAAYLGALRKAGLCQKRYSKCLANPESLTKL